MKHLKHLMFFAAAIAILTITAHTAPGGGGGKNRPKATLTFDDLPGDAIQSDGLGPYEVTVEQEVDRIYGDEETVVSLGKKQALFFDFSDCDESANLSCEGPFGPDTTSAEVVDVTIRFRQDLLGAPGTTGRVGVRFVFRTVEGQWRLTSVADVHRFDDDNDGVADRYVIEDDGTSSWSLTKFVNRRGFGGGANYIPHGKFFMPWGATLRLP